MVTVDESESQLQQDGEIEGSQQGQEERHTHDGAISPTTLTPKSVVCVLMHACMYTKLIIIGLLHERSPSHPLLMILKWRF